MEQSMLIKYVELERKIKQLEEEKKILRESIQIELENTGADSLRTEFATFSIQERKTWKYSDTVKKLEYQLKEYRKLEEQDGTATCEVSKSLRVQLVN